MNKKTNYIKPELLCPVGNIFALKAAVENGADAVYLGLDKYSARSLAENFTMDNIAEAIDYCHLRGVKVYVALNTILLDKELEEAIEIAKELYVLGADSYIVQDVGLLERLSKIMPDMPLHISTQATIYSAEGIKVFEKYNIKRVVLARETTLEEIKYIKRDSKIPIEVFVHGALCVSYSGQCLMSSFIGARSGNRGKCAQPCRMKYDILEKEKNGSYIMAPKEIVKQKYCISPKDLCLLENIPDLILAGVDSLKIEGRMKSPEYVGIVTRIYRKYIDNAIAIINNEVTNNIYDKYILDEKDKKELIQIFSRGGFTKGYLQNSNPTELIYNELPKHTGIYLGTVREYIKDKSNIILKLEEPLSIGDGVEVLNDSLPGSVISFIRHGKERVNIAKEGSIVTIGDVKGNVNVGDKVYKISSKSINEEISQTYMYGRNIKKVDITAKATLKIHRPLRLELSYLGYTGISESEKICEKGITKSFSKDDIVENICKFGDTSFNVENIEIDMDEGVFIPLSQINTVRREAIAKLELAICNEYKREKDKLNLENVKIVDVKEGDKESKLNNKISVYLYNPSNFEGLEDVDRIYLPFDKVIQNIDFLKSIKESNLKDKEICIDLGNISKGETKKKILDNIETIKRIGNVLVGNLEQIEMLKGLNLSIEVDSSLNTYNSNSIEFFNSMDINKISLSNELTIDQILNLNLDITNNELSVNIYGRLPVMTMQSCIISNNISKKIHCSLCDKKNYCLKDRVGDIFPISTNTLDCRNIVLSSNVIFNLEAVSKLNQKITTFRLYFFDETAKQRENIIKKVKTVINTGDYINHSTAGYVKGHFSRGV